MSTRPAPPLEGNCAAKPNIATSQNLTSQPNKISYGPLLIQWVFCLPLATKSEVVDVRSYSLECDTRDTQKQQELKAKAGWGPNQPVLKARKLCTGGYTEQKIRKPAIV